MPKKLKLPKFVQPRYDCRGVIGPRGQCAGANGCGAPMGNCAYQGWKGDPSEPDARFPVWICVLLVLTLACIAWMACLVPFVELKP